MLLLLFVVVVGVVVVVVVVVGGVLAAVGVDIVGVGGHFLIPKRYVLVSPLAPHHTHPPGDTEAKCVKNYVFRYLLWF